MRWGPNFEVGALVKTRIKLTFETKLSIEEYHESKAAADAAKPGRRHFKFMTVEPEEIGLVVQLVYLENYKENSHVYVLFRDEIIIASVLCLEHVVGQRIK